MVNNQLHAPDTLYTEQEDRWELNRDGSGAEEEILSP
jgi:hypothetical protein